MTPGSGDELGRLDLGDFGTYVIEDDGDSDSFVHSRIETDDGDARFSNISNLVMDLRRSGMDDSEIKDTFDDLNRRLRHDPTTRPKGDKKSSSTGAMSGPVAFKCSECGRTCPRTWNTNPGGGSDVCKECDDGDAANGGGSP